jgi:hypothetical protein
LACCGSSIGLEEQRYISVAHPWRTGGWKLKAECGLAQAFVELQITELVPRRGFDGLDDGACLGIRGKLHIERQHSSQAWHAPASLIITLPGERHELAVDDVHFLCEIARVVIHLNRWRTRIPRAEAWNGWRGMSRPNRVEDAGAKAFARAAEPALARR